MITLISLSGGHDGSSNFSFIFLSLWSRLRKFLNFPCLMRFSIYCFKSKHSSVSCPWSLWKRQYLFLLCLLGISLHLHKYLFKQHVQGRVLLTPCWKACLLVVSIFLLSRPCLLWMRTLLKMAWEIYFHTLNSLPLLSYNCIFCIHEVLCWMDKFSHGLRLLLIKLMDE